METADPNVSQRSARDRNGSGGFMETELQYDRLKNGAKRQRAGFRKRTRLKVCATLTSTADCSHNRLALGRQPCQKHRRPSKHRRATNGNFPESGPRKIRWIRGTPSRNASTVSARKSRTWPAPASTILPEDDLSDIAGTAGAS